MLILQIFQIQVLVGQVLLAQGERVVEAPQLLQEEG
jgi:hypothetical protein